MIDSGDERAPALRYGTPFGREHRELTQAEECAQWLVEAIAGNRG